MAYFLVTLLLFSSLEVASKPLTGYIAAMQLTFFRFSLGFLAILAAMAARGKLPMLRDLRGRDWWRLAFLGILNICVSMTLLQKAVENAPASTAAAIFCSNPLFVYLFSLLAGDVKARGRTVTGLAAGIVGLFLVTSADGLVLSRGILYAILASATFGLYTFLAKRALKTVPSLCLNAVTFFFGSLGCAVVLLFTGVSLKVPPAVLSTLSSLAVFLFLGIGVSGVGYITYMATVERLGALTASLVFMIKPVVAALLAMAFLGERPGLAFYPGVVLVLAGSLLITGAASSRRGGSPTAS